jgi:hypothetical protein
MLSQTLPPAEPAAVMRFELLQEIPLEDYCVEVALDELSGQQVYALLNNHIVLANPKHEIIGNFVHESKKKINRVKMSEGLICVASQEKTVTFIDPKSGQAVKKIQSMFMYLTQPRPILSM